MTDNLSVKQARAIAALLSERTHVAAAEKAGIAEKTLYLWLADPAFQAAYQQARRQAVQHAMAQLQHLTSEAVATLEKLLSSSKPTVQLGAARLILEMAHQWVAVEDLAKRVEAIERDNAPVEA